MMDSPMLVAGDTTTQTITFLEKLIKEDDNETSDNKLEDDEKADASTKVRG
jgi:hypothetical protein